MSYLKNIFLILAFSTSVLNAQNSSSLPIKSSNEKSFFTFNLLAPINPFNSRWRVGYVKSLDDNWKLGLDFGCGSRKISWTNTGGFLSSSEMENDYRLWEIRPELYYMLNPTKKTKAYLSTELFYINHRDVFHNDYIATKSGGFFRYESADFYRQKYGVHIKTGAFIRTGKRIGLNIYTGIGFRFREITFSNINNLVPWEDHRDMLVIDYNEYEGLFFGWNWSFGLKLYFGSKTSLK